MKNWEFICIFIALVIIFSGIYFDFKNTLEAKERVLTLCLQEGYDPQVCQKLIDDSFSLF